MKIFQYVRQYAQKYIFLVIMFFLLNLIIWVSSMVFPYITGKYIDVVCATKDKTDIYHYTSFLILIITVFIITSYALSLVDAKLKAQISYHMNISVIEHLKKLPLLYFNEVDIAYMNQRVNSDTSYITSFVIENYVNMLIKTLTILFLTAYIVRLDLRLGISLIILVPMYIFLYLLFRKKLFKTEYAYRESQNKFFSRINEQLYRIKLLKINSWYDKFSEELYQSFAVLFRSLLNFTRVSYLFSNSGVAIGYFAKILLFFFGGLEIIKGRMTIGEFTIINAYFFMIIDSTGYFIGFGQAYQGALVSFVRIQELLMKQEEHNGEYHVEDIHKITLEDVSFSYHDKKEILQNFNYSFHKGKLYCIAGSNGSGKSTLLDLLLGLYENYTGRILYDGRDIRELNLYAARRKLIGMIEQEPMLLNASIKANLIYGAEPGTVQEEAIRYWCDRFHIYGLITGLPDGFDTNISETSSNISGGEKQKISLSRLFIKNPGVLIFDEASSAIDAFGIQELKNILGEVKQDKIVIFVTHNNNIISIADEVISMD